MTASANISRSGTVALVGRSNVGKSTLLNAALQLPLAIVSRKPQTTRVQLLGVVRHAGAEIGLLDTPGLHRADSRLGKEMNRAARIAARDADVVAFVGCLPPRPRGELSIHPAEARLLAQLPRETPVVLVINKIDLLKDKRPLLPLMAAYNDLHPFAAVVPISAKQDDGIRRVLDEVAKLLPEGEAVHAADIITDRPLRHFAAEYVREPILEATGQEVPHAVAITIEELIEPAGDKAARVSATIHVERQGQKRILIGKGGDMLKRIGIAARKRIAALMECQVHLQLWVRVTPKWRQQPRQLHDFGLMGDRALGAAQDASGPSPEELQAAVEAMQRAAEADETEEDEAEEAQDDHESIDGITISPDDVEDDPDEISDGQDDDGQSDEGAETESQSDEGAETESDRTEGDAS